MRLVAGIELRERLTPYDALRLSRIFVAVRDGKLSNRRAAREILKICTMRKFFWPWQLRHANEVLRAQGMLNDDGDAEAPDKIKLSDAESHLMSICSYLAANLKKLPHEIATGLTNAEMIKVYAELTKHKFENWLMMALGYHNPAALHKHAEDARGRLSDGSKPMEPRSEMPPGYQTPKRILSFFGA